MKLDTVAIKKHIALAGWSIKAVALRAGMTPQNLSKVLIRGTCTLATAGKIANALDMDISDVWKEA